MGRMCHLDSSHCDVGTCACARVCPPTRLHPSLPLRQPAAGSKLLRQRPGGEAGAAQRSGSPVPHVTRRVLSGRQGLHFGTDAACTRLSLGTPGIQPLGKPGRTSPELSTSPGCFPSRGVAARRRSWSCPGAPGALLRLALPLPSVLPATWAQRGCLPSSGVAVPCLFFHGAFFCQRDLL